MSSVFGVIRMATEMWQIEKCIGIGSEEGHSHAMARTVPSRTHSPAEAIGRAMMWSAGAITLLRVT